MGSTNNFDIVFKRNNVRAGLLGLSNTSFGTNALINVTTGIDNTALGQGVLRNTTTTSYNVGIGSNALRFNTSNGNVGIGFEALTSMTTNDNYPNTAIGRGSLRNNTTGNSNSAIGDQALFANTTGVSNSALGTYALFANTTGVANNAMGYNSMLSNTTGFRNVALGNAALYNNISGSYNTAVGNNAFQIGANYSNSTALGFNTVITASDQARIGNNAVTSIGGQVGWTTVSDARFKNENVQKVPGIDFIKKLRPVTYFVNYNAMNSFTGANKQNASNEHSSTSNGANDYQPNYQKTLESGFMAQEVEQAAKELGYEFNGVDAPKSNGDYYGLRYAMFVVPLVKAVQELDEKLEQKELENKTLKLLLLELEARISKLEKRG